MEYPLSALWCNWFLELLLGPPSDELQCGIVSQISLILLYIAFGHGVSSQQQKWSWNVMVWILNAPAPKVFPWMLGSLCNCFLRQAFWEVFDPNNSSSTHLRMHTLMESWEMMENLRHDACWKNWVTGDVPLRATHCPTPIATARSSEAQQFSSHSTIPPQAYKRLDRRGKLQKSQDKIIFFSFMLLILGRYFVIAMKNWLTPQLGSVMLCSSGPKPSLSLGSQKSAFCSTRRLAWVFEWIFWHSSFWASTRFCRVLLTVTNKLQQSQVNLPLPGWALLEGNSVARGGKDVPTPNSHQLTAFIPPSLVVQDGCVIDESVQLPEMTRHQGVIGWLGAISGPCSPSQRQHLTQWRGWLMVAPVPCHKRIYF